MQKRPITLILAIAAAAAFGTASAQDTPPADPGPMTQEQRNAIREAHRAQWEAMSEEERAIFREERRAMMVERRKAAKERWEAMSEEERAAFREERRQRADERRAEMRKRYDNMSEEERQALRDRKRQHRPGVGRGKRGGFSKRGGRW